MTSSIFVVPFGASRLGPILLLSPVLSQLPLLLFLRILSYTIYMGAPRLFPFLPVPSKLLRWLPFEFSSTGSFVYCTWPSALVSLRSFLDILGTPLSYINLVFFW